MRHTVFTILALFLASPFAFADAMFDLDKTHSRIGFSARHMVISNVQGEFKDYSGQYMMNEKDELTGAMLTIKVASIDTDDEKRDKHLKSPDFFDAAKYPDIIFKSTKITHNGSAYTVEGNLTMKGTTKKVVLTGELIGKVKDPWGNTRTGFHAVGEVNRKDFGVNFHKVLDAGGLLVSDEIKIILDIEGIESKKTMNPCNPCAGKKMKHKMNPCNPCAGKKM